MSIYVSHVYHIFYHETELSHLLYGNSFSFLVYLLFLFLLTYFDDNTIISQLYHTSIDVYVMMSVFCE